MLTTPLNKWGSKLLDFTIYQCTATCFSAQVDEGLITFVCSRMFVIKCMCMFCFGLLTHSYLKQSSSAPRLLLLSWILPCLHKVWCFLVPFFVGVLADEAENIAAAHDDVLLAKILDKEECEALKMGAYLGVAAASTNPPKFIHLRYTPPSGDVKTKLAIVGKGLTFDRCIIQHMICITLLLSNG